MNLDQIIEWMKRSDEQPRQEMQAAMDRVDEPDPDEPDFSAAQTPEELAEMMEAEVGEELTDEHRKDLLEMAQLAFEEQEQMASAEEFPYGLELTAPPATPAALDRVEAALGHPLPPSYRRLMLEWGRGMPLALPINWYRAVNQYGYRGLVEQNADRPIESLIYILPLGNGDQFALDTTRRDAAGEPVVVRTDHEAWDERTTDESPNLLAFLEVYLKELEKVGLAPPQREDGA